jgi:cytochrome c oxidase subunit 1
MAIKMMFFFVNKFGRCSAAERLRLTLRVRAATTLEWTLSSLPPFHQFETLPRVD